jgi:uncharacterized protein YceK
MNHLAFSVVITTSIFLSLIITLSLDGCSSAIVKLKLNNVRLYNVKV